MKRIRPLRLAAPKLEPIHPSIVKAICAVGRDIKAVSKSQFNQHGKYKYASADDIYAATARRIAEAGLVIMPVELEPVTIKRFEVTDKEGFKKTQQWGRFRFGFVLATEEATWFDPRSARTLFIQITGPQTFNAAESYAQKAYERGLWKIPTGDMDLDGLAQAETEEEFAAANAAPAKVKRKSSYSAKKDGESVDRFNSIRAEIAAAAQLKDEAALMEITRRHDGWGDLPSKWADLLDDDFNAALEDARALQGAG